MLSLNFILFAFVLPFSICFCIGTPRKLFIFLWKTSGIYFGLLYLILQILYAACVYFHVLWQWSRTYDNFLSSLNISLNSCSHMWQRFFCISFSFFFFSIDNIFFFDLIISVACFLRFAQNFSTESLPL